VSATTNSRGLALPRVVAQQLALDRFMTFLSQPRAARVVILAALRASAVPQARDGTAHSVRSVPPPTGEPKRLDRQRYEFGLGVIQASRQVWAIVPRSSPELDMPSSGVNGAQDMD
jgi:hypothetical protein